MKGIILAGGKGSRLYPVTTVTNKHLLPVYDKPMIYYPLALLMLAGIKDILIISSREDIPSFRILLGNGERFGVNITYAEQEQPRGIGEAFIIGKEFIGNSRVALALGDNIFYGDGLQAKLLQATSCSTGASVFAYRVKDPHRFGVLNVDRSLKPISIEEKPKNPKSNWVLTGLYFYDNDVINIAENLQPSIRGELEITDINKEYLKRNALNVIYLGRGNAWLDTGTHEALLEAGEFVKLFEKRKSQKVFCPEEIAYKLGYINMDQFKKAVSDMPSSSYKEDLEYFIKEEEETIIEL